MTIKLMVETINFSLQKFWIIQKCFKDKMQNNNKFGISFFSLFKKQLFVTKFRLIMSLNQ